MSDDIFTQSQWNNSQTSSDRNVPISKSFDSRDNNQIIKISMVFPQVGIVTHG